MSTAVRQWLKLYGEQSESWKSAHEDAMACRDFEDHLAFGVWLFHQINRIDERWRANVRAGKVEYVRDEDEGIEKTYQQWSEFSHLCLQVLEKFEKAGFAVDGAGDFRRCCREVHGVLQSDEDFFTDDALVEMRDKAIDAHRRGDTAQFENLGD